MREIKFRAFSDKRNRFIDMYWDFDIVDGVLIYEQRSALSDKNEFAIEQYTGIKDKNGVEIYEGDVIQYGEDKDFRFVVIFKHGCFYSHNLLGEMFMTDSLLGSLVMSDKVEVIGNIHENADLLEEQ